MFTGIIQQLGTVQEVQNAAHGMRLLIHAGDWAYVPGHGDSIAVNGCCLTAAGVDREASGLVMAFDVIQQTLSATTLGELKPRMRVNLEHAVTASTLLGGHIVQGHVDAVGAVTGVERNGGEYRLRIAPPVQAMACIVEKGSIAVSGVSLTVAASGVDWFEVALIPTTLTLTNLGALEIGNRVNLETDYVAKTVVNWLERMGGSLRPRE